MEAVLCRPACVITPCSAVNCQPFSAQFAAHIHHSSFNVRHSQLAFPSTVHVCSVVSAKPPHLSTCLCRQAGRQLLRSTANGPTPVARLNGKVGQTWCRLRLQTANDKRSTANVFTNYSTTNLPLTDLRSYQTRYK